MLQDPPSRKGFLPSFAGFKSFCPPTTKPAVAFYVFLSFLSFYTVLLMASSSSMEVLQLDIYTPTGCFGTGSRKFRLSNVYSRSLPGSTKSVGPSTALPDVNFACLVAPDFNIHNDTFDPIRVISRSEAKASTPYFDRATDLAYSRLNTPRVYTRFPLSGIFRPSAIDLAFGNTLICAAFASWDAMTLHSTGSDHTFQGSTRWAPTPLSDPQNTFSSPSPSLSSQCPLVTPPICSQSLPQTAPLTPPPSPLRSARHILQWRKISGMGVFLFFRPWAIFGF